VNLKALTIKGQDCYLANGQLVAPTLRVNPGEQTKTIVLNLTNNLSTPKKSTAMAATTTTNDCRGGMAPLNSTSLHFHGLNVSPKCHQDEVVKTWIKPGETFEYKVEIPGKEPPGLNWYHPHVHMQSEDQVLKGLTGVVIVEGIGKFNQRAAELPERVFVLRDTYRANPAVPNGPAKDISINSVPIRYLTEGQYDPPAVIQMSPNQEQFWRVANTAADTYFDLKVTYDDIPQKLELVAMDGVPLNAESGKPPKLTLVEHIALPPAGRAEFIIKAPGKGVKEAKFLTQNFDTGPEGDNDPQRTLARIEPKEVRLNAALMASELGVDLNQVSGDRFSGLSQTKPIKERSLIFDENNPTVFYIYEKGHPKIAFRPDLPPAITVQEGTTEDWSVTNITKEVHAFHIHQIHFLVLNSPDLKEIGMLRDTLNVPPGKSVKLRMDFRGKGSSIAGTFVYHCHILEHEDKGMMAAIQVKR